MSSFSAHRAAVRQSEHEALIGPAEVNPALYGGPEPPTILHGSGLLALPGEDYRDPARDDDRDHEVARRTARSLARGVLLSTYQPILQQCNETSYNQVRTHLETALEEGQHSGSNLPISIVYLGADLSGGASTIDMLRKLLREKW